MDWTEIVRETAGILRAVEKDLLASEETRVAAQASADNARLTSSRTENARAVHGSQVRHLIELRTQRELLLTAPPGTPGVEAALRNIQEAIRRLSLT